MPPYLTLVTSHDEVPRDEPDLPAEVRRIEREIEAAGAAAERCRKSALLARAAIIAAGVVLPLAFWRSDPTLLVVAISALLGGLAFAGSTRTTRDELLGRMANLEADRRDLIDAIGLVDTTGSLAAGSTPADDPAGG